MTDNKIIYDKDLVKYLKKYFSQNEDNDCSRCYFKNGHSHCNKLPICTWFENIEIDEIKENDTNAF